MLAVRRSIVRGIRAGLSDDCITTPWFSPGLSDRMKNILSRGRKIYSYQKKEHLLLETEMSNKIILVLSGAASSEIVQYSLSKPVLTMGFHASGSTFGYLSYLTGAINPMRVTAVMPTEVCFLTYAQLDDVLSTEEGLRAEFLRFSFCSLRSEAEAILVTSSLFAEERYWVFMAAMMLSYGISTDKEWLNIPAKITRVMLADFLYVTTLTIDRLLLDLSSRNMLRKHGKQCQLHISGIEKGMEWIRGRNVIYN